MTESTFLLPVDAKVLTLVDSEDWSPLWIQRTVLNMPYGAEWQPVELTTIEAFQTDVMGCESLECVRSIADAHFGYKELYVVMGRERLSGLCVTPHDCDNFELVLESGDSIVGALQVTSQ